MKKRNSTYTVVGSWVILAAVLIVALFFFNGTGTKVNELKTGELIQAIKKEEVTEITITPKSTESVIYVEGKLEGYDKNESFTAKVIGEDLTLVQEYASSKDIKEYETEKDPGSSNIGYIIFNLLPI